MSKPITLDDIEALPTDADGNVLVPIAMAEALLEQGQAVLATSRLFTEADYEELDPGIREVVRFLRENDFETTDSGDGLTKLAGMSPEEIAAQDEVIPEPHVFIVTERGEMLDEADRLHGLFVAVGFEEDAIGVQALYSPGDGVPILMLTGVSDAAFLETRSRS